MNQTNNSDNSNLTQKREENLTARERSLQNLKPFSSTHQPTNHPGRPKKDHILLRELARALHSKIPGDPQKRTFYRLICEGLARKAAKGDVDAARMIFDRQLGRVRDAEEVEHPSTIIVQVNRNVPRAFHAEDSELKNS